MRSRPLCLLLLAGLISSSALFTGCTPPTTGGNENINENDNTNVNENEPGQEIPDEIDVTIEGEGTVGQETIGNDLLQLTAVPADGWQFAGWTGAIISSDNPLTLRPELDMAVTATFTELPPGDADGDGVADAIDQCPNTQDDLTVDSGGCAENQLDSDDDGITDDVDQCDETPAGANVDTHGCALNERDSDNDGITDNQDDCANTPAGSSVNDDGCALSQLDSDDDGVTDNIDECPDTPAGDEVDAAGCEPTDGCNGATGNCFNSHPSPGCNDSACCSAVCDFNGVCCLGEWDATCAAIANAICDTGNPGGGPGGGPIGGGGAVCGNGVVEAGEDCDPNDTNVCVDCRFVCGNGFLQGNEQCEPPNTASCDAQCRLISQGGPNTSPAGDWLTDQFLYNTVIPAYIAPETYRLNATGGLTTAFITIDPQYTNSGSIMVPPGVLTEVFEFVAGSSSFVLNSRIDNFDLNINPDLTTLWAFDFTTNFDVTDPFFGDLVGSIRQQGTQTGTIGGTPEQIVWTTLTGMITYCYETPEFSCEDCVDSGGTCDANECCVYPADPKSMPLGKWVRSGG